MYFMALDATKQLQKVQGTCNKLKYKHRCGSYAHLVDATYRIAVLYMQFN